MRYVAAREREKEFVRGGSMPAKKAAEGVVKKKKKGWPRNHRCVMQKRDVPHLQKSEGGGKDETRGKGLRICTRTEGEKRVRRAWLEKPDKGLEGEPPIC